MDIEKLENEVQNLRKLLLEKESQLRKLKRITVRHQFKAAMRFNLRKKFEKFRNLISHKCEC